MTTTKINNDVKVSRSTQTTARKQRGVYERQNWLKIPEEVENRFREKGLVLRWIRVSLKGQYDDQNVQTKQYEGWDFVKPEDVPEMSAGFQNQAAGSLGNLVIRGDVALAANTIESNDGYKQHVDEFTQSQTDAINRQLMSKNDPRMPISNNSRSKVTTGRPTHFNK